MECFCQVPEITSHQCPDMPAPGSRTRLVRKLLDCSHLALQLVSIAFIPIAGAAIWPEQPVRILIPWPPGCRTDVVGMRIAATPPDGYTLMMSETVK